MKDPGTAARPRTVLSLFAHPDDETFGPGGTLARLADEGHALHLMCATRGESGSIGKSSSYGRRRLAALREAELEAAREVLGIRSLEIIGLPDGGLRRLEPETLVLPFVRAIRTFRPDILITFHADGISGHADHRTVTARTLTAWERAADRAFAPHLGEPHATPRVWAYSIPDSAARRVTHRKLYSVPDEAVDAVLEVSAYSPVKRRAVEVHATQKLFIEDMERRLGGLGALWGRECFVLAASRVPLPGKAPRPVEDLFAGMP